MAAHVFHWRHGWIPMSGPARLAKANGDEGMAASMLAAAHGGSAGIRSRQDVARAVRDLPNVPHEHRLPLRQETIAAAQRVNATDLLPSSWLSRSSASPRRRAG